MDVTAPRQLDSQLDSEEPRLEVEVEVGASIAGKYVLTRRIGWGSMGEVWSATHATLGKDVAIKLVRVDAQHGDGLPSTVRFRLEAQLAAQLSRKTRHIVSVTDHGEDGSLAYLVMELLTGESLETRLARTGPMPLAKVVPIVYQIARALTVAHVDGVIHRDLKPSNVWVTVDEQGKALVKIFDFGIAKTSTSLGSIPAALPEGAPKHGTVAGLLLGTPAYMSPEQACGRPLDARADVWALAVTAYQLLADELPFDGASLPEILGQIARADAMPISFYRADLPDTVLDLFDRAFSENIDDRFATAAGFATALEQAAAPAASVGASPEPMGAITVPPPLPVAGGPGVAVVTPEPAAAALLPPPVEDEGDLAPAGLPRWRWSGRGLGQLRTTTVAGSLLGAALAIALLSPAEPPLSAPVAAAVAGGGSPGAAAAPPPTTMATTTPGASEPMPPEPAIAERAPARVKLPFATTAGPREPVAGRGPGPPPARAADAELPPRSSATEPVPRERARRVDRAEIF